MTAPPGRSHPTMEIALMETSLPISGPGPAAWHHAFLAMLPAIRRSVRPALHHLHGDHRDEPVQWRWPTPESRSRDSSSQAGPGRAGIPVRAGPLRRGSGPRRSAHRHPLECPRCRDTGRPPSIPRVRRADLLASDDAEGPVPEDADLVFRQVRPRRPGAPRVHVRPAKRIHRVRVGPKEQGIPRKVDMTCSGSQICLRDRIGRGAAG